MNGIILKKERLEVLDLNVYNKPKTIYIPVIGNNITILVKKGDYVFKGSIVYKRRDFQFPVFSSISGKIIDIIETSNLDNQKYIIIKNDFKEKLEKGIEKTNEKINKEMFLKLLKENGITESGNPVYQKYDTDKKINTLIINGIDNEFIIKEYCEEILQTIDRIMEICGIPSATIIIKKTDKILLRKINTYIGTYLNIKVLLVKKEIKLNNKVNIINNPLTIYNIYQMLKTNKPVLEKFVTIFFDNKKMPILIKLGTSIKEVIKYFNIEYKSKNIYVNNQIISEKMLESLIVTDKLNKIEIK